MPPRTHSNKAAKKAESTRASTRASSSANAAALAEPAPAPSPSSGDKRTRGKKPAKQSAVADEMDDEAEQARLKVDTKKASKQSLRQEFSKYSSDLLYWWGMDYDGWTVSVTDAANRDKVIDALVKMKAEVPKNEQEIIQTYKKLVRTEYKGEWKHTEEKQRRVAVDESDEGDEEEEEEEPHELPNKRRKLSAASSAASSSSSSSTSLRCRFCQTPTDSGLCPHCGCSSMYDYNNEVNVDLRRFHLSRLATAGTEQKTVHASAAASASSESEKKETALSGRDKEWKRQTEEGESFPRFTAAPSSYSVKKAFEDMRKSYYGANFVQPSDAMIKLIQSGKLRSIGHATLKSTKEELESDGRDNSEAKLTFDAKGLRVSEKFKPPPVNSLSSFLKIITGAIIPSLVMQPQAMLDWIALTRSVLLLNEQYGWDSAQLYLSTTLTNSVANRTPFGEVDMVSFNAMMAARMHGSNFGIQRAGGDDNDYSSSSAAAYQNRPCRYYNKAQGCQVKNCKFLHICSNRSCQQPEGHNFIACPMRREGNGDSSSVKPSSASFYPSRSSGASSGSRSSSSFKSGRDRHVTFNTKDDAPGKQ